MPILFNAPVVKITAIIAAMTTTAPATEQPIIIFLFLGSMFCSDIIFLLVKDSNSSFLFYNDIMFRLKSKVTALLRVKMQALNCADVLFVIY